MLTALGNLFGLGGSSLISRMMGASSDTYDYAESYLFWVVAGAAMATAFSNTASILFFIAQYIRLHMMMVHLASAYGDIPVAAYGVVKRIDQDLLNISLLLLMNIIFGLYGMIWTQLVVEIIMLPISLGMYFHTLRGLKE